MSSNSIGALLGLLIAAGLLLVVSRLGATRKLRMAERIAPYVGCRDPRQDEQSAVGALLVLLKPRLLSGRGDLALSLRLGRAGRGGELDRYRFDQVTFAAGGVIAGGALGLVLIAKGAPAIGVVLLAVFGAIGGVLVADRRLAKQGKARQRRIGQQLPTIAELLALRWQRVSPRWLHLKGWRVRQLAISPMRFGCRLQICIAVRLWIKRCAGWPIAPGALTSNASLTA